MRIALIIFAILLLAAVYIGNTSYNLIIEFTGIQEDYNEMRLELDNVYKYFSHREKIARELMDRDDFLKDQISLSNIRISALEQNNGKLEKIPQPLKKKK